MANVIDRQILEEGPRNAVVKLTGVLDSSDVSELPAFAPSDFSNNDANNGRLIGFRVDHVTYVIADGLEVLLSWHANTPRQIVPLAGRGKIDATDDGGFMPNLLDSGFNGAVDLVTNGWVGGRGALNFTIFMRLVKLYSG